MTHHQNMPPEPDDGAHLPRAATGEGGTNLRGSTMPDATTKALTLGDVVRSLCDGVFDAATQRARVKAALLTMPEFADEVYTLAAEEAVDRYRYASRAAVKHNAPMPCRSGAAGVAVAGAMMSSAFGDRWVFADGRCLNAVLGGDLRQHIEQHYSEAEGSARAARFLEAIEAKVPARGKVGNYVKDAELTALWEATDNE